MAFLGWGQRGKKKGSKDPEFQGRVQGPALKKECDFLVLIGGGFGSVEGR